MPSNKKSIKKAGSKAVRTQRPSRPGDSIRAAARRVAKGKRRIAPVGSSRASSPSPQLGKQAPPPQAPVPELPARFGADRIVLMARDPWWVYAYWEVLDRSRKDAQKRLKDPAGKLVIRMYELRGDTFSQKNIARYEDVLVTDAPVGHWYLNIWNEGALYAAEVGLKGKDGKFQGIIRSNPINSTSGSLSDEIDEQWVTVDRDYQEMFQLSPGMSGQMPTAASSMDVRRLLARKLETELSSGAVAAFSSNAYPAHVAEAKAEQAAKAPSQFWLQVATELIVYGATEPDADLTVMGQPIKLRKDGTFTLRFALPEGHYDIPVHARSRDKQHERTITPIVDRTSR